MYKHMGLAAGQSSWYKDRNARGNLALSAPRTENYIVNGIREAVEWPCSHCQASGPVCATET